ncbi:MAG: alpha/beta fold hydrolase [Planctomycetes bacterium]|nr:alpha/beta fold hydrolase [Planctomycetota bacterium]
MSWHRESRFLALPQGRAHVVDHGQGPAVLLLHGFLHSAWTWRELIEPLAARGLRVIALDLYGYGSSAEVAQGEALDLACWRRWLDDALAALGIDRLALACGNSLGAALILDLSERLPTERLALINPLCARLRLPRLPFRLLGLRPLRGLFGLTAGQPAFTRRALRLTAYREHPVDAEVLRGFRHLSRPSAHHAACATAESLGSISGHAASLAPRVSTSTPTLCLLGERDAVLGRRYRARVEAALPGARVVRLARSGHCPQEGDPARVLSELDQLWTPPR